MNNLLKMDIYRMLKSRSTWILMVIMIVDVLISMVSSGDAETDLALEVMYGTDYFKNVTTFICNQDALIIITIFAVIFTNGLYKTGFITNVIGYVRNRFYIIISSMVTIAIFEVILFIVLALATYIGTASYGETIVFADYTCFFKFIVVQFFMYLSYSTVIVALVTFIRNSAICLTVTLVYTSFIGVVIWTFIDKCIVNKVSEKFSVLNYLLTYNISQTTMTSVLSLSNYSRLWFVLGIWGVAMLGLSYVGIKKKSLG